MNMRVRFYQSLRQSNNKHDIIMYQRLSNHSGFKYLQISALYNSLYLSRMKEVITYGGRNTQIERVRLCRDMVGEDLLGIMNLIESQLVGD